MFCRYLAWAIERRSIAHELRRALPLPGYGVAALSYPAMQDLAAARAMEPVAQRRGVEWLPLKLNPASFECSCRQTARSTEAHPR